MPGGQILDSLTIECDGTFFSYNYAYDKLTVSQIYIVDHKGIVFPLPLDDAEPAAVVAIESNDKNLTDWIPAEINPSRVGEYEVELLGGAVWPMSANIDAQWDGLTWRNHLDVTIKIKQWRGISEEG